MYLLMYCNTRSDVNTHMEKIYVYKNSDINCDNDKKSQRFCNNQFGSNTYLLYQ